MSSSLYAIEAAAFLLPPEERAKLAERLIASLERNPEVEKAWEEEIKRRIAEFAAGRIESIPAETVFEEARDRLRA